MCFNATYYDEISYKIIQEWSGGKGALPKRQAIVILTKITAFLSLLGSSYIIFFMICQGPSKRRIRLRTTFHRLLLGLSISDVLSSMACFLGTWLMPRDGMDASFFWGSAGTPATCTAQGFVLVLGWISTSFFFACICINFVLIVRYQWKEERLRKLQPFFLIFVIVLSISFPVYLAVTDNFHPGGIACSVEVYPYFCKWADPNRLDECLTKGGDSTGSKIYFIMLCFIVVVLLLVIVSMVLIFLTVRKQEMKQSRWTTSSKRREGQRAREVAYRALFYISAYLFTSIPIVVCGLLANHWSLGLTIAVSFPLQGFSDALIYSGKLDRFFTRCGNSRGILSSITKMGSSFSKSFGSPMLNSSLHQQKNGAAVDNSSAVIRGEGVPANPRNELKVSEEASVMANHDVPELVIRFSICRDELDIEDLKNIEAKE